MHETWSLALRKNFGCVLRDVFWPKCDEITEDWRKLHMGDLRDLYSTNSIWVTK